MPSWDRGVSSAGAGCLRIRYRVITRSSREFEALDLRFETPAENFGVKRIFEAIARAA